jgi:hypothetical protein
MKNKKIRKTKKRDGDELAWAIASRSKKKGPEYDVGM